jgi:hypothetical protein
VHTIWCAFVVAMLPIVRRNQAEHSLPGCQQDPAATREVRRGIQAILRVELGQLGPRRLVGESGAAAIRAFDSPDYLGNEGFYPVFPSHSQMSWYTGKWRSLVSLDFVCVCTVSVYEGVKLCAVPCSYCMDVYCGAWGVPLFSCALPCACYSFVI